MLDLILSWLRSRVKAAVLAGFSDALGQLDGDDAHDLAATALVARLQSLPPPEEGTRKRK